jgi:cobalt transporter subunit CbtB
MLKPNFNDLMHTRFLTNLPKEIPMTEPTMLIHSPSETLNADLRLLRPLLAAAALGLIVLYGVAFAESPLAHNAAHDVRHVTVKPCH